jgi:hypothetical protein
MRAISFETYVSTLSRYDNSIWEPVKSSRKPVSAIPPMRLETQNQVRWAQSDKEKAAVFANHLAGVFQPHEEETDEELSEYLQLPVEPATPIKPVSPKEIKAVISRLNLKKSAWHRLNNPPNFEGTAPQRHNSTCLLIQCHTQASILASHT